MKIHRPISVDRARAQYLRRLAELNQCAGSTDEAEIKAANAHLQQAKSALQVAQRTSRLRRGSPRLPARHPEWNSEPT